MARTALRETSPLEGTRSELRRLVSDVDEELEELRRTGAAGPTDNLASAFKALVDMLALGPEPETRRCPHCGAIGMRAATLCANCWSKLEPPAIERAITIPADPGTAEREPPTPEPT
jgi:hypothetical protein